MGDVAKTVWVVNFMVTGRVAYGRVAARVALALLRNRQDLSRLRGIRSWSGKDSKGFGVIVRAEARLP